MVDNAYVKIGAFLLKRIVVYTFLHNCSKARLHVLFDGFVVIICYKLQSPFSAIEYFELHVCITHTCLHNPSKF